MFKTLFSIALAACVAPCFAEGAWIHDDIELARKQAGGKCLLIEFTGSDWCLPCNKLRREVLTRPGFEAEASKDFVLLELDYPRMKEQPAAVKEANRKLADEYGIEAFPTVIFTDSLGRPLGSFVGVKDEAEILKLMEGALATHRELRLHTQQAIDARRNDRPEEAMLHYDAILKAVPAKYHDRFYSGIKGTLKHLDSEDRYGYHAADARQARVARQMEEVKAYLGAKLGPHTDPQVALDAVKNCPGRDSAEPEVLQEILVTEWQCTLSATGDADAGIAILDRVIALNPHSRLGKEAVELRELTERQRTIIWQRYMDYQERRKGK